MKNVLSAFALALVVAGCTGKPSSGPKMSLSEIARFSGGSVSLKKGLSLPESTGPLVQAINAAGLTLVQTHQVRPKKIGLNFELAKVEQSQGGVSASLIVQFIHVDGSLLYQEGIVASGATYEAFSQDIVAATEGLLPQIYCDLVIKICEKRDLSELDGYMIEDPLPLNSPDSTGLETAGTAADTLALPVEGEGADAVEAPQEAVDRRPVENAGATTVSNIVAETGQEEVQAAVAAPAPDQVANSAKLGETVVSLGPIDETGVWVKTPLVKSEQAGRVVLKKTGKSINVTLVPKASAGSQMSAPAYVALGVNITELAEVEIYSN